MVHIDRSSERDNLVRDVDLICDFLGPYFVQCLPSILSEPIKSRNKVKVNVPYPERRSQAHE